MAYYIGEFIGQVLVFHIIALCFVCFIWSRVRIMSQGVPFSSKDIAVRTMIIGVLLTVVFVIA